MTDHNASIAADRDFFATHFEPLPLMAILRGFDTARTVELSVRAWDVGIRLVEVPIQSAGALDALASAVEAGAARARPVGAGTVITVEQVRQAARAGAAFTVSPGFDREVAEASLAAGCRTCPGRHGERGAARHGVRPQLAEDVPGLRPRPRLDRFDAGPLPQAKFVATGGMHLGNTPVYLDAGASGVSLGSALADPHSSRDCASSPLH
ncbi:bifunctional 4-hydroxy-2-oxoglutarate aldolase/2-dehydro-3-deoxy-phosphogluconate aldolase [Streptomyces sp. M10(2022)]